jgi:hypothetical protein
VCKSEPRTGHEGEKGSTDIVLSWTMKHQISSIVHHEAEIHISSDYCNVNGAFLFTPQDQLTL